jgi:hypothetical protein
MTRGGPRRHVRPQDGTDIDARDRIKSSAGSRVGEHVVGPPKVRGLSRPLTGPASPLISRWYTPAEPERVGSPDTRILILIERKHGWVAGAAMPTVGSNLAPDTANLRAL